VTGCVSFHPPKAQSSVILTWIDIALPSPRTRQMAAPTARQICGVKSRSIRITSYKAVTEVNLCHETSQQHALSSMFSFLTSVGNRAAMCYRQTQNQRKKTFQPLNNISNTNRIKRKIKVKVIILLFMLGVKSLTLSMLSLYKK
jgi:hypothetical protein